MIDEEMFWSEYDLAMKHLKRMDEIARKYFIDKAVDKYKLMEEKER